MSFSISACSVVVVILSLWLYQTVCIENMIVLRIRDAPSRLLKMIYNPGDKLNQLVTYRYINVIEMSIIILKNFKTSYFYPNLGYCLGKRSSLEVTDNISKYLLYIKIYLFFRDIYIERWRKFWNFLQRAYFIALYCCTDLLKKIFVQI